MGSYTHLQTAKQLETSTAYTTHKPTMEYDQLVSCCRICQNLSCEILSHMVRYSATINTNTKTIIENIPFHEDRLSLA